jgi:hypothetical protein
MSIWDDDQPGRYTRAVICLRGHMATPDSESNPEAARGKFCSECGSALIIACPECGASIRGHYVPPGATGVGGSFPRAPNFCAECGKPFPWTIEKLTAAKDLADELDEVNADDRAKLKVAIDEVAAGGPRAEVGAARIKRILGKTGTAVGKAFWQIAVEVGSEAAKKILLGG